MHPVPMRARGVRATGAAASLLLASAACGGGPPPQAAAPSPAVERAAPGDHRLSLRVAGDRRDYLVHAPKSFGGSPLPAVLVLHGSSGHGQDARDMSGMDAQADKSGFLAVYPESSGKVWNTFDSGDQVFLHTLITHLERTWHADPARIYIAGFSNGGAEALWAGAGLPDVFAGVAAVAPATRLDSYRIKGPKVPPLIVFAGGKDPDVDVVEDNLALWREGANCAYPRSTAIKAGITRTSWRCRAGAPSVLYSLPRTSHDWPGGYQGHADLEDDSPISATRLIWAFFARHTGAPAATPSAN